MRATKFRGRRIARILLSALAAGAVIWGGLTSPVLATTSLSATTPPAQLPPATTTPIPPPGGWVVASPFATWYSQAIAAPYGPPNGDTTCWEPDICHQYFQNGEAFWNPSRGVQGVLSTTPTGAKFFADGGYFAEGGYKALGFPLGDEVCTAPHGGCYQWFEKGLTWWSPTTAASTVRTDGFQTLYEQKNWAWGPMGYPLGDINCTGPGGGCYQWFQGGITWAGASFGGWGGSWVHGGIEAKYAQLNWAWGPLGYPHLEEMYGYGNGGSVQYFDKGQILWSPTTGASWIHGAISSGWFQNGYYGGIGYPTEDEQHTAPNSGCYQWFQNGVYFWSPATGANYVHGAIKSTYESLGWAWGRLGYPTSNEYGADRGPVTRQDFEHGSITWTSYGGTQVIWR